MKAFLVLENGNIFEGESFGYEGQEVGEVVFNTSMAGYQEILTDPSYCKQIVTLTYPMAGNYGISPENMESKKIQASGLIVKEYVDYPSNFTSEETLKSFLVRHKVPGIQGIDTRKLTRLIRDKGAPKGGIFIAEKYDNSFLEEIKKFPGLKGMDLAQVVSTTERYSFGEHTSDKPNIAVYDYGVKTNILRKLDQTGFSVHVLPAKYPIQDALQENFSGFLLSNGPGDPEPLDYAIETAKTIIDSGKPVLGICLGHQIIGQAMGRKTGKLKFGHRGGNQPVQNTKTKKVEMTSQNHGFTVLGEDSQANPISHKNLNDNTIAGIETKGKPILSVQYHPENSPGPRDAEYIFEDFYKMVTEGKN
ncbi:MAG: glutamine-hydrolyzing carbamoyl-phosphate synthase small subunit [Spirochaetota bacterium]